MGPWNARLSCLVTNDNSRPFLTPRLVNVQCTNAGSCSLNSLNEEINPFGNLLRHMILLGIFSVCCIFISFRLRAGVFMSWSLACQKFGLCQTQSIKY